MLEVRDLSSGYGDRAIIRDISADFPSRHITSIIGPNGAGKTTFIKTLAGLLKYEGSLRIEDHGELKELSIRERAKLIAYVPQTFNTQLNFTAGEMIAMGRYPHEGPGRTVVHNDRIEAVAERIGIKHILNKPFSRLSGGEQRLVIVARALAQETPIILFDEPGSFLDLTHSYTFLRLLLLLKEEGKTIVMVTHDLNVASLYSDRILILKEGRIAIEGPPEETLTYRNIMDIFGVEVYYTLYPGTTRPIVAPLRFPIPEQRND